MTIETYEDAAEPMLGVSFTAQDAIDIRAWDAAASEWGLRVVATYGDETFEQLAHVGLQGDVAVSMYRRVGDERLALESQIGPETAVVDTITEARVVVAGWLRKEAARGHTEILR